MIRRFFPNWDALRKLKMCRWCPGDKTIGTLRVRTKNVDVWVCREHTDQALDEVIRCWKEIN